MTTTYWKRRNLQFSAWICAASNLEEDWPALWNMMDRDQMKCELCLITERIFFFLQFWCKNPCLEELFIVNLIMLSSFQTWKNIISTYFGIYTHTSHWLIYLHILLWDGNSTSYGLGSLIYLPKLCNQIPKFDFTNSSLYIVKYLNISLEPHIF